MYRIIVFVLTVTLFLSCKEEKEAKFNTENYKKHFLKFTNKSIYLPKNYEKIDIDNYIDKLKENKFLIDEKKFDSYKNFPYEKILFYNKSSMRNCIIVFDSEYIHINKDIARGVVSVLYQLLI